MANLRVLLVDVFEELEREEARLGPQLVRQLAVLRRFHEEARVRNGNDHHQRTCRKDCHKTTGRLQCQEEQAARSLSCLSRRTADRSLRNPCARPGKIRATIMCRGRFAFRRIKPNCWDNVP